MSDRLFEQTDDNNPVTSFRIAFGKAATATFNITLANFLTWLNANLTFPSVPDVIAEEVAFTGWDMDQFPGFQVAWALPAGHEIIGMSAVINAGSTQTWDLSGFDTGSLDGTVNGGVFDYSGGNFNLKRKTGGDFDQAAPFNNADGYVLVHHKDFS